MNKLFCCVLIFLLLGCSRNDKNLYSIKDAVYIPSTYKLVDLRESEDFLTDGPSQMIFIFEIDSRDYKEFIEKNKLVNIKESSRWTDYYNEDFDFYPYNIKKELNLSKCKDLNKFYYNIWSDNNAGIECFFDSNIGLVVISYEY